MDIPNYTWSGFIILCIKELLYKVVRKISIKVIRESTIFPFINSISSYTYLVATFLAILFVLRKPKDVLA